MHVNTSIGGVVVVAGGVSAVLLMVIAAPVLEPRFAEICDGDVFDMLGIDIGNRKLSLVSMSQMRTEKSPVTNKQTYTKTWSQQSDCVFVRGMTFVIVEGICMVWVLGHGAGGYKTLPKCYLQLRWVYY